jgi:glycosyltransferase involved in cell wall biosynthesis
MIEVIISDNASTDDTQGICQDFIKKDNRVKYVKQLSNKGPSTNFNEVLKRASGKYFMWLGDDDWIDPSYVRHCMSFLRTDCDLALVSGAPIYYRDGVKAYEGRVFDFLETSWCTRVARYYLMAADNGMFYGIMRTAQLQKIVIPNIMGGDWHLIANIVSTGKSRMSPLVAVHRELGGATTSYRQIAKSLGLPAIQAIFPMTTIALGACDSIVFKGAAYKKRSIFTRMILAGFVFLLVIIKSPLGYAWQVKRFLKDRILIRK